MASHLVAQGGGVDAQPGRAVDQGGQEAPAHFVVGDADFGQGAGEMQGQGDVLQARAVGQVRLVGSS